MGVHGEMVGVGNGEKVDLGRVEMMMAVALFGLVGVLGELNGDVAVGEIMRACAVGE